MQRIRNIVAILAALSALTACDTAIAAGMSPDPSGLWFDPAESGWGLALVQRDDTIFALLLVYDEERRPTWYVASDVAADDPASADPAAMHYTGVLYRTTGPWFGGPFDPQAVVSAAVGTISLQYAPGAPGHSMAITCSANGVTNSRELAPQVQPQSLSTEPPRRSEAH